MMNKVSLLVFCIGIVPQVALSMDANGNQRALCTLSYLNLKQAPTELTIRRIRNLNTDTTVAFPAIDVISHCAREDAKQELVKSPLALSEACLLGNLTKVQLFLDAGASVNGIDRFGKTPLHWAVRSENEGMIKLLIDNGADLKEIKEELRKHPNALFGACIFNNFTEALRLLYGGACVNGVDEFGKTPLLYAVSKDNERITKLLIDHGARLDIQDNDGLTPLHKAIVLNCPKAAGVLIKHGAAVNARDNSGQTMLYYAVHYNRKEIAELLLNHGADVNALNVVDTRDTNFCQTALHLAVLGNYKKIVKLLISHGAAVDALDSLGDTPLHSIVDSNYHEIAALLVSTSFFHPHSAVPSSGDKVSLPALCLHSLFKNLNNFDEDALNNQVIPDVISYFDGRLNLKDNEAFQTFADQTPLMVQQAVVNFWQQNSSDINNNRLQLLLQTHLERHLAKIKHMVTAKNSYGMKLTTLVSIMADCSTVNGAKGKSYNKILRILCNIENAQRFSDLHPSRQQAIRRAIEDKLAILSNQIKYLAIVKSPTIKRKGVNSFTPFLHTLRNQESMK